MDDLHIRSSTDRFRGICNIVAAVIIATAITFHALAAPKAEQIGRYQFHPSTPPGIMWVIDTTTGKVTAQNN